MQKRRIVITGMGIVSSIGNNQHEVLASLNNSKSGIVKEDIYQELGFRTNVHGSIKLEAQQLIDKKTYRFMGQAAAYAYLAMREAIEDAKLSPEQISNSRTGLITGSGGSSNKDIVECADILRKSGIKRLGPYRVPRTMGSTTSACLATEFAIKGMAYSVSSACATSAHCISSACDQIILGRQDMMFAGGGEELDWSLTMLFDSMGALSSKYNDNPTQASRAFDVQRDGFVISGGGGILVLEELEHAKARGANIIAEIINYGASSDGENMVQPDKQGAMRCMQNALEGINQPIDYINAHGTSTVVGDANEANAIKEVFTNRQKQAPFISSTKSLTGHSLGAAGVHEAIYSLLMLKNQFICPSINIDNLCEEAKELPFIMKKQAANLNTVMSNSFGFGGVNSSLIFSNQI